MLVSIVVGFCFQLGTPGPFKTELSLWRRANFACFGCLLLGWLLEANMAPTWPQLDPKIQPNSLPNPSKSHSKTKTNIKQVFDCFLDAFLLDSGRFWVPTWGGEDGPTEWLLEVLLALGPSWGQDGPKSPPRSSQDLILEDFESF